MTHIARLFYNNTSWQQPTNTDIFAGMSYGIKVNYPKFKYRFGLEEWLFNKITLKIKIGFLECYRQKPYHNITDKIMLVTRYPDGNFYHIGNVYGVMQLNNDEIEHIRQILLAQGWAHLVQDHFAALGDTRTFVGHTEYQNHWRSNAIIKQPADNNNTGFCFNISYKKIELLKEYVNLTTLANPLNINRQIQKLSIRYIANSLIGFLPNQNNLQHYLNNQNI